METMDITETIKCKECVAMGQRSYVYPGVTSSTLMYSSPFYDEDGNWHYHDPNIRTTEYSCSEGHKWEAKSRYRCWCEKTLSIDTEEGE